MKTFLLNSIFVSIAIWYYAVSLSAQVVWQQATLPANEALRVVAMQDSIALGLGQYSLFRSGDFGKTWVRIPDSTLALRTSEQQKGDFDVQVYPIQFGTQKMFFVFNDIAYRSLDNARSWQRITSLHERISSVVAVGQVLVARATSGALYRSNDGGGVWSSFETSGMIQVSRMIDFFSNGKAIFQVFNSTNASSVVSVFRSLDTGKTWQDVRWNLSADITSSITQSDTVWILNNGSANKIFRSIDNGLTWQVTQQGLLNLPYNFSGSLIQANNKIYLVNSTSFYVFVPSKSSWEEIPSKSTTNFTFFPVLRNSSILFSYRNQMLRSDDEGKTWTNASQGLVPQTVFPLSVTSVGLFAAAAGATAPEDDNFGRVAFSGDQGNSWQPTNISFAITRDGVIETGNSLWTSFLLFFPMKSDRKSSPTDFVQIPSAYGTPKAGNDSVLFIINLGSGLLIESRDEGANYRRNSLNGVPFEYGFPSVNDILLQGSTVFAASDSGMYRSQDIGRTWIKTSSSDIFRNRRIRPTVLLKNTTLFATVNPQFISISRGYELSPNFYCSRDSGKTWERLNLPDSSGVHAIVNINNTVFAASTSNIYQSTNEGRTWQRISQALPYGKITTLANDSNTLYACILGQGLFKAAISTVGIQHEQTETFRSSPAPNPTSEAADIIFILPRPAQVRLALYSALGTEVWRSEGASYPAGEQRMSVDTHHLPTGVYAYRLTADGVQSVGRIVVVR